MGPRWNIMISTEIQDGCQWPYWKLPLRVILVLFISEANVILLFHIISGHWIHFWDLCGWNVIFATEIQDGRQWPYWKLPLRVISVLFVSEANVITLFHIFQGQWIHFWDLYGWNVFFIAEIQDGCLWPYLKFAQRAILVPFVSETKMILLFYIIQGCWIHLLGLHCSRNVYSVNALKINIKTFYTFF